MAIEHIFDQIGGFNRFQWLMILWVYTFKFMVGWSTMILSYATYKNDHACIIDSVFNESELHTLNASEVWARAEEGIQNQSLINVCEVDGVKCQGFYFFGVRRTIVSEWSLVCDLRWMKATITSIQFGGVLTGAVFAGQSGDYFGRKNTLYGTYLLHTILNVVSPYSVTWQMFAVMRFLLGIMIGAVLVIIVPYPTEFFPLHWRHIIPAIPMWPLGVIAFAGGAWFLEDWADLHLVCAVLSVPGLLGYFYMPESARWLATRGREEEAYAVLQKMAKVNGRKLPSTAVDTIKKIATEEKMFRKGRDYSYLDLFKGKETAKVTIIAGFQWFVLSTVFYGLSFGVTSFAGNLYLNIFLMSAVTLPANLLSFLLISRIGRRWTCVGFLAIAAIVSYVCVILHLKAPEALAKKLISYFCLLAKLSVAACWTASQTWVTESYPTVTRSLGYGFANTTSRVGAVIAPFVMNLDEMPLFAYILMGTLTLLSTISTCFLPETRDKVMAETVQEKRWKENADIKGSSDEETVVPLTSEGGQTFKTFNPS